jgi:hypothetical protein
MLRRLGLTAIVLAAVAQLGASARSGAVFTASAGSTGNSVASAYDWTAPNVAMIDPGSPLFGTVTLSATASDDRTSVASVAIQYAPTGTSTWTTVCTVTAAPYSCSWATTSVTDGSYDFRATAVDTAGNPATSATVASRAISNTTAVTITDPGDSVRGTINLSATATDSVGIASVKFQRSNDGVTWTDVCTDTTSPYGCPLDTTTLTDDNWFVRAIATSKSGNTATSATPDFLVDNTGPTVSLTDPGTPIRGTVTLTATAADDTSGVAQVVVQYTPSGTTNWTTVCTATASPYSCAWKTTAVADGNYDLRAVATDAAGNTTTSTTIATRKVDNTVSSVSVTDPGPFLRGTVTIAADANSTAGVASVRIQRAPSGTTTWTDLCLDITAPFSCTFNTTTVADGLYDFRAILIDGLAKTTTSATVSARRVDNTPARGYDVQAVNGGSIVGRIETNDTLSFTYSTTINPASILTGWTGTSTSVVLRARDGVLSGGAAAADTLDFWTTTQYKTAVNLGSVALNGDFVRKNKTVGVTCTMVASTVTVNGVNATKITLTLGATTGGGLRTYNTAKNMTWTPSGSALDTAGNTVSTAPVTELGTLDRDF